MFFFVLPPPSESDCQTLSRQFWASLNLFQATPTDNPQATHLIVWFSRNTLRSPSYFSRSRRSTHRKCPPTPSRCPEPSSVQQSKCRPISLGLRWVAFWRFKLVRDDWKHSEFKWLCPVLDNENDDQSMIEDAKRRSITLSFDESIMNRSGIGWLGFRFQFSMIKSKSWHPPIWFFRTLDLSNDFQLLCQLVNRVVIWKLFCVTFQFVESDKRPFTALFVCRNNSNYKIEVTYLNRCQHGKPYVWIKQFELTLADNV